LILSKANLQLIDRHNEEVLLGENKDEEKKKKLQITSETKF
jgi:hypothetical protein